MKYRSNPGDLVDKLLKDKAAKRDLYKFWPETLIVMVAPFEQPYLRACFLKDVTCLGDFHPLSSFLKVKNMDQLKKAEKETEMIFETNYMVNVFNYQKMREKSTIYGERSIYCNTKN